MKIHLLFAAIWSANVQIVQPLHRCIQDSFVCRMKLYLAAQTDETQAGRLLRALELVYLSLAQCQFNMQVNERRKLHLPLCSLPWGGSLCFSQSTVVYSDKFHYKTTQSMTMTGEFISPPSHCYSHMYVKRLELSSRLSYREVFLQSNLHPCSSFYAFF